jgi:hypothetical protein
MKYESRITELTITPIGKPIFCEEAMVVRIDNEAAGEFVIVSQGDGKLAIDPDEWPAIRRAINDMVMRCK